MTRKDFYNAVIEANLNDEMTEFATKALEKLDKEAEHRRNTPTKKQKENEEIKLEILSHFTAGVAMSGAEVADVMGITPQRANALLRQLVSAGSLEVEEVKNGKRLINSYRIAE